ncbi:MAG: response regulator [Spirochaetaceae bacterium]|nr:response regulator [Spirochaetaceae bacterium]
MEDIGVLVVEDDFMVARINKEFTEKVEGFRVVGIAKSGAEALRAIDELKPELVILDVYLPDVQGLELLKTLRAGDYPLDFILITAAHDARTIQESMRFGAFDYIIKPFDFARYERSLTAYKRQRESLEADRPLDQGLVDAAFGAGKAAGKAAGDRPKGINPSTGAMIEKAVAALGPGFGIDDVASELELSRITVHRYLENMVAEGTLVKEFKYRQVGRPSAVYSKKPGL